MLLTSFAYYQPYSLTESCFYLTPFISSIFLIFKCFLISILSSTIDFLPFNPILTTLPKLAALESSLLHYIFSHSLPLHVFFYIILIMNPVLFYPHYLGRTRKHTTRSLSGLHLPPPFIKLKQGRNDTRKYRHDAVERSPLFPATFSANLYRSYL